MPCKLPHQSDRVSYCFYWGCLCIPRLLVDYCEKRDPERFAYLFGHFAFLIGHPAHVGHHSDDFRDAFDEVFGLKSEACWPSFQVRVQCELNLISHMLQRVHVCKMREITSFQTCRTAILLAEVEVVW